MIICNYGNKFNYELEKLTRLFMPFERIDVVNGDVESEKKAITKTDFFDDYCLVFVCVAIGDKKAEKSLTVCKCNDFDKTVELKLAGCLYDCLAEIFDYKPCWGILTGIRPARLYLKKLNELGLPAANSYFTDVLKVSPDKLSLLSDTAISEQRIIGLSKSNSFSLYISIPFCPTRCSYCSFVSHSIEKASDIIPEYIDSLFAEITATAKITSDLNLNLETVYIGGGTPTSLSAEQLEKLLTVIDNNFDMKNIREYTVEAGRPDTVTPSKLSVLKAHNVTRISINPQTLNDNVLNIIGRRHTADDFFNAFFMARKIGFENINTDIIAGLPGDDYHSFKETIDKIIKLSPEAVTVHSLSMKRSSKLTLNGFEPLIKEGETASKMVNYARELLSNHGILPYYMYRQSKTVGNLENVGYAKKDFEGLYNVYIMDETHSILACGASAVTKLKNQATGHIARIFNFKYPYEYINRFDEQLRRKQEIYSFYGTCNENKVML